MAIGAAGTTGMSVVLAADAPAALAVSGSLHDAHGAPLGGIRLVIAQELPPDGGLAGSEVVTGRDGTFVAELAAWGTTDAPAVLTIRTAPGARVEVLGARCNRTVDVTVVDTRDVALANATAPPPIDLVAETTLIGEICGTTATPPADAPTHHAAHVTPPPTDTNPPAIGGPSERLATALLVGFVVGLAAAFLLLVPRPGARRD